jgi:predicted transcriptional regulator
MLNFDALPDPIQKVLIETPEGYRNSAMTFLITFLRNKLGLSQETVIEVLKIWNYHCKPPQDETFIAAETKRLWGYNHKGTGKWDSSLAKRFGYIEFEEYRRQDKIIIPNQLFENYSSLHKTAIKIFFMMKLFEDRDEIKEWDIELIAQVSKISEVTAKRYIKQLVNIGLLDKKRANKKLKQKNKYYFRVYWDKRLGFTKFNPYTIQSMIYSELDKLIDTEIKVYTYIYYMLNGVDNGKCFASQFYLSKKLNLAQNTISEVTNNLHKKRRLIKKTYIGHDNVPHSNYYLRG